MNSTSKTLLSALIISLFSLATLQGYRVITQNPAETQVLGDTTSSSKTVPCDVINNWQKQYCSSIGITAVPISPFPTSVPSPLPTTYCRGGYYSANYGPSCNNNSIYSYYLKFTCADNTQGTVGDINKVKCYNMNDLSHMAETFCSTHSVCAIPTPSACIPNQKCNMNSNCCASQHCANGYCAYTPVVITPTVHIVTPTPVACTILFWYDSSGAGFCSAKQFCGSYMYAGLSTFTTQAACFTARAKVSPTPTPHL